MRFHADLRSLSALVVLCLAMIVHIQYHNWPMIVVGVVAASIIATRA